MRHMLMTAHAFVINRPLAAVLALAAIAAPFLFVKLFVVNSPAQQSDPLKRRRSGLGALVIGSDGRASTSKLQAVLWTFAVFFAIVFMMLWGRSAGCGMSTGPRCQSAHNARAAFDRFVNRDLQPEYFVLLGFPLTAAVAAKAITTAKVENGTMVKEPLRPDEGDGGFAQALREIISNDAGETDLLDAQYFAFNLLTLAFFFTQFLTQPAAGLPDLPATLIALSGLSAAGYTTKKALIGTELTPVAARPAARPATRTAVGHTGPPPPERLVDAPTALSSPAPGAPAPATPPIGGENA